MQTSLASFVRLICYCILQPKGNCYWASVLLGYWANWVNWAHMRLQPLIAPPACEPYYSLRKKMRVFCAF